MSSRRSDRATYAKPSPTARGPLDDDRVLDTQVAALPGREWWYYRALRAHTARRAHAAPGETPCGAPAHHHPSPSRVGRARATRRASPHMARGACGNALLGPNLAKPQILAK